MSAPLDTVPVLARLDRLQTLADHLVKARGDFAEQEEIAEQIHREIEAVKAALQLWSIRTF
jgi:hypothetical protein